MGDRRIVWQRRTTPRVIVSAMLVASALLGGSWAAGSRVYNRYFGPVHPASALRNEAVDHVEWVWAGAVSADSATIVARVEAATASADLVVTPVDGGRAQTITAPVDGTRIARWNATGLRPATTYHYNVTVDGDPDETRGNGELSTFPDRPASFTVAFGGCARTGSNGAVFDAIRAMEPLLYIATGDLHYGDISKNDVSPFLRRYDDVLTAPAQAALYRDVPIAYMWDDHDYGPDDSDATSPSRDAARRAYRQAVPHYSLPAGESDGAVYQAFTVGRVRFIMTDTRSERRDESMLGERQLAWFEDELRTSSRTHALVAWVNPNPWIAPADEARDDWGAFPEERRRIADVIADAEIENLVMLSGDAHMVALDDGTNSDYSSGGGGGFPILHAAALDRPGSVRGGPYSHGAYPGGGRFGTMEVSDEGGDGVSVTLTGHDWRGHTLVEQRFDIQVPQDG